MKVTAQPKKAKSALGKVAQSQGIKKKDKVSGLAGKKKAAVLTMACDSLSTPEKTVVAKSLKGKKTSSDVAAAQNSFQKPTNSKKRGKAAPKLVETASSPVAPLQKKKTKTNVGTPKGAKQKAVKELNGKVSKSTTEKPKKKDKKDVVKKPRSQPKKSPVVTEPLKPELLEGACASILKLLKDSQKGKEKKDIFDAVPEPIMLSFSVFKVPRTPFRRLRCAVPNPVHPDPDVCLILPDIVRGRMRDSTFANYVARYEEKLQEAGVKGIKQIIPFAQLRAEYNQFEMKRRLAKTFDVFLVESRIIDHCTHFLGNFLEKRRLLMPIRALKTTGRDFELAPNIQQQLDVSLRKVGFLLHGHGVTYTATVGHSHLSDKQLAENIQAVWRLLQHDLPGGIKNVRLASLKGLNSTSIPVYASLVPLDKVPVVQPLVQCEAVEDELSTVPGYKVQVLPDGTVNLLNQATKEDNAFRELVGFKKSKRNQPTKGNKGSKRLKTSDDEDDAVAAAEEDYLTRLTIDHEDEEEAEKEKNLEPEKVETKQGGKQWVKKGISQKFNTPNKKQKTPKKTQKA